MYSVLRITVNLSVDEVKVQMKGELCFWDSRRRNYLGRVSSDDTVLRYIDKDNFECPELGVVQKCPMILGEYQSPGGKFF